MDENELMDWHGIYLLSNISDWVIRDTWKLIIVPVNDLNTLKIIIW